MQLQRRISAGAARAADTEPPNPGISWGYAADGPQHGSQPHSSTTHAGAHSSREARAAFLLQHGWADQQQPTQPVSGSLAGDHRAAGARFGSPIQMEPHWHPSREVRLPARPLASNLPSGAVTSAALPGAAAADAQPRVSDTSASGSSAAWHRPLGGVQRHHLEMQLSESSDWDVARAAATPASVTQQPAGSGASRCRRPRPP